MNRSEAQNIMTSDQYFDKGLSYFNNGNYASAIQEFSCVIELNPKGPGAYALRGTSYFRLGKYNEARSDFETVLRLPLSDNRFIDGARKTLAEIKEAERRQG